MTCSYHVNEKTDGASMRSHVQECFPYYTTIEKSIYCFIQVFDKSHVSSIGTKKKTTIPNNIW
jgi:hypothetical protein